MELENLLGFLIDQNIFTSADGKPTEIATVISKKSAAR